MPFSGRAALIGWAMFAISGIFFTISAVESRDLLGLGSAATWLIGVGAFLVDFFADRDSDREAD